MKINGKADIYGLIGYPVKHTFSPRMHNPAFRKAGVNAVYLAFEVKPEELRSSLWCLRALGVRGLNVTIPHKERVVRYLHEIDREASLIKAVNTIVITPGGGMKGYNTDASGFILSLKEESGIALKKKDFFILGAGGAARAVSFALALRGAKRIVLTDTVASKAIALARELNRKTECEAIAIKKDKKAIKELLLNTDVLINATPCGMKKGDPKVIDADLLHRDLFVYDVIYNPPATRLLKDARKKGARTANGLGMLLHQGALSFSLWTGKKAPLRVMKRALVAKKKR